MPRNKAKAEDASDALKERIQQLEEEKTKMAAQFQTEKATMTEENANLQLRIQELEKQLKNGEKKKKEPKPRIYKYKSTEEEDENMEAPASNSSDDPEWKKTPKPKGTGRSKNTLLKKVLVTRTDGKNKPRDIGETSDTKKGVKRKLNEQCACKGSCSTKSCRCKKVSMFCTNNCKCSDNCVNAENKSKESDEDDSE